MTVMILFWPAFGFAATQNPLHGYDLVGSEIFLSMLGGIFSFERIAKEITEQSPWKNWCHLTVTCTSVLEVW